MSRGRSGMATCQSEERQAAAKAELATHLTFQEQAVELSDVQPCPSVVPPLVEPLLLALSVRPEELCTRVPVVVVLVQALHRFLPGVFARVNDWERLREARGEKMDRRDDGTAGGRVSLPRACRPTV